MLADLHKLISLVDTNGGVLFGGVVRDVIIPLHHGFLNTENIDIKDVDILFNCEAHLNSFVKNVPGIHVDTDSEPKVSSDGFMKQRVYYNDSNGYRIFDLDLVVRDATKKSINDFNVNKVFYSPSQDLFTQDNVSLEKIITCIRKKKCIVEYSYLKTLVDNSSNSQPDYDRRMIVEKHRERLITRFVNRGWKVYTVVDSNIVPLVLSINGTMYVCDEPILFSNKDKLKQLISSTWDHAKNHNVLRFIKRGILKGYVYSVDSLMIHGVTESADGMLRSVIQSDIPDILLRDDEYRDSLETEVYRGKTFVDSQITPNWSSGIELK